MKTIDAAQADLAACLNDAQNERVVITRAGRPVAVLVGLQGLDEEQLALCRNGDFWQLITARRQESTMSRAELESSIEQA